MEGLGINSKRRRKEYWSNIHAAIWEFPKVRNPNIVPEIVGSLL